MSSNSNNKNNPAAAARGSELASDFTVSVHYDSRMYREDIMGSIAHARMLGRQGIIEQDEAEKIVEGLTRSEMKSTRVNSSGNTSSKTFT